MTIYSKDLNDTSYNLCKENEKKKLGLNKDSYVSTHWKIDQIFTPVVVASSGW